MEFKTYDEVDPEQVNEIMLMSLGEPNDKKLIERIRRTDPNCSPWFRMYAVEDDQIVSQVGAAYPEIETSEGKMKTGFVEAVATWPSYGRKGYAMKLMKRVHEQMMDDGIEVFILGTGKTLVAYPMYLKLGYHDVAKFSWGLKKGGKYPKNDITIKVRKHKIDNGDEMFRKFVKNSLGFVHRKDDYPRKRSTWGPIYSKAVTFYRNERPMGYALISPNETFLRIRELVCPNLKDYAPCLRTLENRFPRKYVTRSITGRSDLVDQFEAHGLKTMDTWGTMMAMDGKGKLTQKQLRTLLGIDKEIFQVFAVDTY